MPAGSWDGLGASEEGETRATADGDGEAVGIGELLGELLGETLAYAWPDDPDTSNAAEMMASTATMPTMATTRFR
jgi:hypothetical protein